MGSNVGVLVAGRGRRASEGGRPPRLLAAGLNAAGVPTTTPTRPTPGQELRVGCESGVERVAWPGNEPHRKFVLVHDDGRSKSGSAVMHVCFEPCHARSWIFGDLVADVEVRGGVARHHRCLTHSTPQQIEIPRRNSPLALRCAGQPFPPTHTHTHTSRMRDCTCGRAV